MVTFTVNVENHKALPVWLEVEAPVNGPPNAFFEPVPFTGQRAFCGTRGPSFGGS